jgi:hypothetical protein
MFQDCSVCQIEINSGQIAAVLLKLIMHFAAGVVEVDFVAVVDIVEADFADFDS